MKRTLCLLLCLCMVLGCVAILSACNKEYTGEPEVSKKQVEIDFKDYNLVYDATLSISGTSEARELANRFRRVTGETVRPMKDGTGENEKEILVGRLDREETQKALSDIKGHGFVIRVIDSKIVIAGTTNLLTRMAMKYFAEQYLPVGGSRSSTLKINKTVKLEKIPMVELASGGEYHYSFIYSDILDDESGNKNYAKYSVDYPFVVCELAANTLSSTYGVKKPKGMLMTDAAPSQGNEILVGVVERDVCYEVMRGLSADQFGIVVKDGTVMIAAWTDEALVGASDLFVAAMTDSLVEDESGNKAIVMPKDYSDLHQLEDVNWLTDFPRPESEGVDIINATAVSEDSVVYVYRGEGVGLDAFDAYCEQLESEGYVAIVDSTLNTNRFVTYKNEQANATLHVQLQLYPELDELTYSADGAEETAETFKPTIRITAAPLSSVNLPGNDLLDPSADVKEKICETMITAVKIEYGIGNFGMSYIITLEDGSFILLDGGGTGTNGNGDDGNQWHYLNNVILDLFAKVHGGRAPSQSEPLHVRAWIITHEHVDHYGSMKKFIETYGKTNFLKFDYLIANFSTDAEVDNSSNPSHVVRNNVAALQSKVNGGFTYIKVHTGQKLYMQNAELEILYTHEDLAPARVNYFNDTSTVIRITLNSTENGVVKSSNSTVWLGDAFVKGSVTMRAMFGDYLQSDAVQIAHHGGNGVEAELYDAIAPTVLWWPSQAKSVTSYRTKVPTTWYGRVSHYIINDLESVEYIYVSDQYNITLIFTADGPQYESLYDANGSGDKTVPYNSDSAIKTESFRK